MPDPNPKALPSVYYLRECFDYNPETGVIRWRGRRGNKKAGHLEKGYLNLTIDKVHYRAARVIWKIITGEEPPAIIDHADQNKLNNRWSNLRAATPAQSLRNRTSKPKASGPRGVYRRGSKWMVSISGRYIGTYMTVEEAAKTYENAARKLHGEFYHGAISKQE